MIRNFKNEDLDIVMKIWLDTNIKAHKFIKKDYWLNNFDMVKKMLPEAEIYIYEEYNNIRGFVGLIDGYIAGIFVTDSRQNKGIGKELVEKIKKKYDKLTLSVYEKNIKAINFYIKQGFKIIEKTVDENTGEIEMSMEWKKINKK
ncbi:MAG: N-acetyltransferase [Cellulosilyticaceae bacterium]